MSTFRDVKRQSIKGKSFRDLWRFHPHIDGLGNPKTTPVFICHSQNYQNQCAIRLSFALQEWGIDFSDYPDPTCKDPGKLHGRFFSRGAESLANYLTIKIGGVKKNQTQSLVINRTGIVFFKNIQNFRNGNGDHIDLWNGRFTTSGEYFDFCQNLWFFPIT